MAVTPQTVVILDRDGVINCESEAYIKTPDEWRPLPGALAAIARLHAARVRVGIATNQSGVGRGYYTLEALAAIHRKMLRAINEAGGEIERIFFCPHVNADHCDCRKPKPGMLLQAAEHFACGFDNMIYVGDSDRDIEAARAVGIRPVLVRTGNGKATEAKLSAAELPVVYDDLTAFVTAELAEPA